MKNLPDKIYILQHEDYSDRRIFNAFTERESNTDVEYTRTDALIKKAAEWFSEIENGTTITNIDKFIEDFKNHIKGE